MNTDQFAVYIVASQRQGTLYTGVTNNLIRRIWQHKHSYYPGFTAKYGVVKLVYYETFDSIKAAIEREKRLKKWNRAWKVELIEKMNPEWLDLWPSISDESTIIPDGFPLSRE